MLDIVELADDERGIRLADARIPSWWGPASCSLLAFLVRSVRERRTWDKAETSIAEATVLLAQRWHEQAGADAALKVAGPSRRTA